MSSPLPSVAVVIPLHNGGPWIRDTLAAVQAQTHAPTEIVVVDDGSTDNGPAEAASIPGVTVLDLPRSVSVQGAGPGRQHGLASSTAPLVAFLDQDDLWHPEHLRLLATALRDHPGCPAAVSPPCRFTASQSPPFAPPRLNSYLYDPWTDFPVSPLIWSPSGVLVRRSALNAIGGWPTRWSVTDHWTWLRLSLKHPFVANRDVTYAKRDHAASKSMNLRLRAGTTFIQDHARRLAPLIPQRTRHFPEETEVLTTRLRAFVATGLLAGAYSTGTPPPLKKVAAALEPLATTDPQGLELLLDHLFGYFLRPAYRGSPLQQADLLELFATEWPSSAPRAESILQNFLLRGLSLRAVFPFIGRAPSRWARWQMGHTAVRHWIDRRWAHLRDIWFSGPRKAS